jgi:hypothetical protein
MTDSDTKEAIELQIDIAKEILQQLISQPDVAELVAKAARIQYDALHKVSVTLVL